MEEDTQTVSKPAMGEVAQRLQVERAQDTLRATHNTRVAEFRKHANRIIIAMH